MFKPKEDDKESDGKYLLEPVKRNTHVASTHVDLLFKCESVEAKNV